MKKVLMLLSVVFIYVSYAYAQAHEDPCEDHPDFTECYYQFLLKRWREGADGQVQAPIDSVVMQSILRRRSIIINKPSKQRILRRRSRSSYLYGSPEDLKRFEDLERYRGLGIFLYDVDKFRYDCMPPIYSTCDYMDRYDGIAIKMLEWYHNINADIRAICGGRILRYWMNIHSDRLIRVWGLPNDEEIMFLISGATMEVLSTYRYRIKREQRDRVKREHASYAYTQVHEDPCEGYGGPDRTECSYQFLLKRWREGADGQVQAPIDSVVMQSILRRRSIIINKPSKQRILRRRSRSSYLYGSPEDLKRFEDLERYRGLGIFLYDVDKFRYDCMPPIYSTCDYVNRYDGIAIKMLEWYYNINADIRVICGRIHRHWMNIHSDRLIRVWGLPNDEEIMFLISGTTFEVLSTYRYRVKREQGE